MFIDLDVPGPGIEYQPTSRWFLDKSKAGGGILMDWGPYDFAVLNDLFQPTAVEVLGAWTRRPLTQVDPVDTVFDVETHVGAMIRYALQDDPPICIQYERASCTHGEEYHHVEIEGTLGSVRWSPYDFGHPQPIILALDRDGQAGEREIQIQNQSRYGVMDRPLCYFYESLQGLSSLALLNEQAVFNLLCIQAIAKCATTQEPQVVKR
jgi:predicted dehydrogenase